LKVLKVKTCGGAREGGIASVIDMAAAGTSADLISKIAADLDVASEWCDRVEAAQSEVVAS